MQSKRDFPLDLCRALAILLVLVIHCTDLLMSPHNDLDLMQWNIYQSLRIIGRVSVPLFIFISASLIINKSAKYNLFTFYKKRIPQFVVVLFVYGMMTNYISAIVFGEVFSMHDTMIRLLKGDTRYAYQLWYIYVAIGLYLSAPFCYNMLHSLNSSSVSILILILILFSFIPSMLSSVFGLSSFLGSMTFISNSYYMTYFITGYAIYNRLILSRTRPGILFCSALTSFFILILIQNSLKITGKIIGEGYTWYDSLPIFTLSASIFSLIIRVEEFSLAILNNAIEYLSKSSFSVYLFHIIPLTMVIYTSRESLISNYIKLPVLIFYTFSISLLYFYFMDKYKPLKFLIK